MLICDLTQAYTETSGGIRTFIHEKQNFILQHTDHRHVLIVPGEQDTVLRRGRLTVATVKAPSVAGCEPYRFILRLDKVYSILKQFQPDLIELGSAYVLPFPAWRYKQTHHKPLVGFYHTDFPTAYVKPAITQLAGDLIGTSAERLSSQYARLIYNRLDATITSSIELYRKLKTLGIRNLQHIPLGVDLARFHPNQRDERLRQSYGIGHQDLMFFYHGRMDQEKRIDVLLDSFDQISDKVRGRLLLMGNGPLKDLAERKAQSNPKIQVLPYETDRTRLARHLASADIYCTAGPHETFGLSILEAQASGLAVCGVRAGALRERVPDSLGVLAQPDSVSDFASTLYDLSQNGFRQKGQNARHWVERRFSWHTSFQKLLKVYERLV